MFPTQIGSQPARANLPRRFSPKQAALDLSLDLAKMNFTD
jgi:hypothetical protein